jgi:hypothetical protein
MLSPSSRFRSVLIDPVCITVTNNPSRTVTCLSGREPAVSLSDFVPPDLQKEIPSLTASVPAACNTAILAYARHLKDCWSHGHQALKDQKGTLVLEKPLSRDAKALDWLNRLLQSLRQETAGNPPNMAHRLLLSQLEDKMGNPSLKPVVDYQADRFQVSFKKA